MAKDEFIVTSGRGRVGRPEHAKQRNALRMAESFFRRWPLYVLMVVLVLGIGVVQARDAVADFRSVGVVSVVSNPLLGGLSTIQTSGANNYETPAGGTARTMNELLGTDGFLTDVAARAGFDEAVATRSLTLGDIRSHVYAAANGYQLLQVVASWPQAQGAQNIAQATIDAYVDYVLQSQVGKAQQASAFWAARQKSFEGNVTSAQQDLRDYIAAHPEPSVGERNESEQLQIDALTSAIQQAQDQVNNAQAKKEDADLTTQELKTAAGQGLQVLDAPLVPSAPESVRKKQALTLGIYLVLGLLLAVGLLLVSTFLDHTVRGADDISSASGLDVIATVPAIPALYRRKGADDHGPKQLGSAPAAG